MSSFSQVIVLWTANTERFCDVRAGLNDTAENLLNSIYRDEAEVSPSTIFAVASILEGIAYINGSPQNTFVPGCIELAEKHKVSSVVCTSSYNISFSSSHLPPLLPSLLSVTCLVDYFVTVKGLHDTEKAGNWCSSKHLTQRCPGCWPLLPLLATRSTP